MGQRSMIYLLQLALPDCNAKNVLIVSCFGISCVETIFRDFTDDSCASFYAASASFSRRPFPYVVLAFLLF